MEDRRPPSDSRSRPRVPLICLTVAYLIVTNLFDAWATLTLIERGAEESNPLMHAALLMGPERFLLIKMSLVMLSAMLLGLYARRVRWVWYSLVALAVAFSLLLTFHVYLICFVPPP